MAHLQFVDELVKEYLLFRGFTHSLRTYENDLKIDKDKGFRVDRLTDQIVSCIQTYDLQGLKDLWGHLDRWIFVRLNPTLNQHVRKLEVSILRLYIINTIQTSKPDKLSEFFEKMAPELQSQSEWKEWFVLPYLKGADEIPTFAMYFTRQWQDTLLVSLTNFLAVVFQNLPVPTLARYEEESSHLKNLQEELECLRVRLNAAVNVSSSSGCPSLNESLPQPPPPSHLMDDFYNIAQETNLGAESQSRSLKNLFGFGSSSPQQTGGGGPNTQDRGRSHSNSASSQVEGTAPRRASSQAPPADRKRGRTSSATPTSASRSGSGSERQSSSAAVKSNSSGQEHQPVKRLGGSRRSRSPHKQSYGGGKSESSEGSHRAAAAAAFVVQSESTIEREESTVVSCVSLNPTSQLLAIGDLSAAVTVYSATTADRWQKKSGSNGDSGGGMRGRMASLEWLSDRVLFSATHQSNMSLWDCQDHRLLWETGSDHLSQLKERRIMCATASPSNTSVVLSAAPRTGRPSPQHTGSSPASSRPPVILHLDVKTKQVQTSHSVMSAVNSCAVNHNGSLVVCGCSDGCLRILDLRTPDVIATWAAHKGQVFTVQLSHHQDKIYAIGSDNKLSCWSFSQTGSKLLEQTLHKQAAGPFMVSSTDDSSGRSVLLRPYGALFALHDDDKHVLTCSTTGSKIYEVDGSRLHHVQEFGRHQQSVTTLDWCGSSASDGGTCVTASLDGVVCVTKLGCNATGC